MINISEMELFIHLGNSNANNAALLLLADQTYRVKCLIRRKMIKMLNDELFHCNLGLIVVWLNNTFTC